jgi:hypothetical protein
VGEGEGVADNDDDEEEPEVGGAAKLAAVAHGIAVAEAEREVAKVTAEVAMVDNGGSGSGNGEEGGGGGETRRGGVSCQPRASSQAVRSMEEVHSGRRGWKWGLRLHPRCLAPADPAAPSPLLACRLSGRRTTTSRLRAIEADSRCPCARMGPAKGLRAGLPARRAAASSNVTEQDAVPGRARCLARTLSLSLCALLLIP